MGGPQRTWLALGASAGVSGLVGQARTYEALKRAAIEAGRFSALEVTTGNARLFDQLCSDPAVKVWDAGYTAPRCASAQCRCPWTGVRVRRDR